MVEVETWQHLPTEYEGYQLLWRLRRGGDENLTGKKFPVLGSASDLSILATGTAVR